MEEIGQVERGLVPRASPASGKVRERLLFAIFALCLAAAPALWLWAFTVDDALISIRYARHLALGAGYRWNLDGPVTDGVTPLAWPFLLLPLSHAAPLVVLARSKALGLVVWLGTAAAWGAAIGKAPAARGAKIAALVGLAVCTPLAAHAVSGMETAVATALATGAALLHARPRLAALLGGLAASLRPEMVPWALALAALLAADGDPPRARRVALSSGIALAPFLVVSALRVVVFGSPAPLALLAKPSDLTHGALYATAAALVSVGPVMACAPLAAVREKGSGRALVASGIVQLVAVAIAGGDWMPYARLIAPVVPSLLYASVLVSPFTRAPFAWARAGLAFVLGARTLLIAAPAGRHAGPDRETLAREVAPLLEGCARVASVDIGWVSAATEGDIVDLAGVTDPEIATLPGGHTSKRVDGALLLGKHPDALLLFAMKPDLPLERWPEGAFPRAVEARLAADGLVQGHFRAVAFVRLGETGMGYYVLLASPAE